MRNRAEQWIDWQTSRYYKEPYWLDWQEAECGRAWEETMFGGEISPINNRVDGSHGVGITDYPSRGTDIDPERKTWSTISMRYVEQLFQMSTWQRSFDLNDWRIFNIPRDGAKSLYINSFTTMEQSEEQRAANEDLAELVALANAQPAKKMRIKSTGKREEQRAEDVEVIEEAVAEQEHQPKSSKRQVPAFTGTRRLSSVMAGALPEVSERRILKPRIRRPVSNYPIGSTSLQQRQLQLLRASKGTQILRLCASKKDTGEIYDVYERSLMSGKLMNAIIAKPQNRRGKEPTSELVKRIKRQPKGLLERYRRRRRVEAVRKQDEEGRKQGLAWTKVLGLQQKMIEKAEGKNQADGTNDPDEQPHWERQQAVAGQEEAGGRES